MAIGVRGINPIWFEVDLQSNHFDDNFWFYVLENTIPYIPETVYHDPDLTIPWTNPIQFLANGTLPVDIFFDPDKVYRLEFRRNLGLAPPSQDDPLIYEVNDYVPTSGSITPTPVVSLTSENEMTNGQFAIINFASPMTITDPGSYEIAPGWVLDLGGAGTATVTRVPLNSTNPNLSNAPYALHLVLAGWTSDSVKLKQRFQQNGILWSGKFVASTVTARVGGAGFVSLTANLYDSMGTFLTTVLSVPTVNGSFNEFPGHGLVPASTNTDVPPSAYIEYQLLLPSTLDIYLTSFQLTVSATEVEPTYIQDTVDRQIDHTFHNYQDSLLRQQKQSVLTGWDFPLNPWQFYDTAVTNLPTNKYVADQTIVIQQKYVASATGNNISTSRGASGQNFAFTVTAVTATNQFALIQYIDPTTMRGGWGEIFSSMVKLTSVLQATDLHMKMRLIYNSSLPATTTQTVPIATWAANDEPVFSAGWSSLTPKNDPNYLIANGFNTLLFEGFELPAALSGAMTLGIVLYTTSSMTSTGTPDKILFDSISLVQNEFAIDVPSLTFDETLRRCQYYYTKSFLTATLPADNAGLSSGVSFGIQVNAIATPNTNGPIVRFSSQMRGVPTVTLYNPSGGAVGQIRDYDVGADWALCAASQINQLGFVTTGTPGGAVGDLVGVNWTASAVLGA